MRLEQKWLRLRHEIMHGTRPEKFRKPVTQRDQAVPDSRQRTGQNTVWDRNGHFYPRRLAQTEVAQDEAEQASDQAAKDLGDSETSL